MQSWGNGRFSSVSCSIAIGIIAFSASAFAQRGAVKEVPKVGHPAPAHENLGCFPSNDDCATPTVVGLGTTAFTNVCATSQGTDPICANNFPASSVWFAFTAASSTAHSVDTCGSFFDSILGVFTAPTSCGPYVELACNDDRSGLCSPQSQVTFCAQSGTTYYIYVDGFQGDQNTGMLTITDLGTACSNPANDECSSATVLTGPFPATGSESTAFATNSGDPLSNCGFANSHSVWFSVTPAGNGQATFETCGSDYDTVVGVFTGTCGSLSEIACNDDAAVSCASGSLQSRVTWPVTGGTTYSILVMAYGPNGIGGNLSYSLDVVPEEILCRAGNINGGVLPVTDTLKVNGSAGSNPDRIVMVTPTTPFNLHIDATPAGGMRYAMYVWGGAPTAATIRTLPMGVGRICRVTPINGGAGQPARIANNTGRPQAGTENWPGPQTLPAPYTLLNLPGGLGRSGTFFFQGIQFDAGSPSGLAGVTNGILVVSM
ncbi:MAG: hypothetical protein HYR85_24980 [Planctomycetes bacterium]|nr:hypothetical protein [Planctomycetota bacterium]MBI3847258.1 hypothetical protein [Planctomycetota bacterium]